MYHFLNKFGQGLAFGLGALIVVVFLFSMSSDAGKGILTPETVSQSGATGIGGIVVIALIAIAITAMLVFSIINNLHRPIVAGISGLLTLGWLYAFFAIIVPSLFNPLVESDEPLLANGLTAAQDSIVTMGITLTLGLIGLAVLSLFGSLLYNLIRG